MSFTVYTGFLALYLTVGGCSCLTCREREVQDVKMELEELQRNPPKPTTDDATAVGKGELAAQYP